jgi:hypothetical protein
LILNRLPFGPVDFPVGPDHGGCLLPWDHAPNAGPPSRARLTLLEWWNRPPTQPLRQPGQSEVAADLSVSGRFIIVTAGDNFKYETVQSNHHLNYDGFFRAARRCCTLRGLIAAKL